MIVGDVFYGEEIGSQAYSPYGYNAAPNPLNQLDHLPFTMSLHTSSGGARAPLLHNTPPWPPGSLGMAVNVHEFKDDADMMYGKGRS